MEDKIAECMQAGFTREEAEKRMTPRDCVLIGNDQRVTISERTAHEAYRVMKKNGIAVIMPKCIKMTKVLFPMPSKN